MFSQDFDFCKKQKMRNFPQFLTTGNRSFNRKIFRNLKPGINQIFASNIPLNFSSLLRDFKRYVDIFVISELLSNPYFFVHNPLNGKSVRDH